MTDGDAAMTKPILCLDFDGVIHDYREGWQDGAIYGNVTPGFWEWATKAREHFKLVIYSSRSLHDNGRTAMWSWFKHQWGNWRHHGAGKDLDDAVSYEDFEFARAKPPAFITIDDRCVRFDGHWDASQLDPLSMRAFKPWMNR